MPRVGIFSFGSIVVDGKKFSKDVMVHSGGEVEEKDGSHNFTVDDFHDMILKEPEVIIIGTGTAGNVKIDKNVFSEAKKEGISLIAKFTPDAIKEFNSFPQKKKISAVFHLTC